MWSCFHDSLCCDGSPQDWLSRSSPGRGEAVVGGVGTCSVDELGVLLEADHRCRPAPLPGGWEHVDESEGTDVVEGRALPDREGLIHALRHVDSIGPAHGERGVWRVAGSIGLDAREPQGAEPFDELIPDR